MNIIYRAVFAARDTCMTVGANGSHIARMIAATIRERSDVMNLEIGLPV